MIDEGQGQPRSIAEGRIAYDGIAATGLRLPSQVVGLDEVKAGRNQLDGCSPVRVQEVEEGALAGPGIDEVVVVYRRVVLGHGSDQGRMTLLGDLRPREEAIQIDRVEIDPLRNEGVGPPFIHGAVERGDCGHAVESPEQKMIGSFGNDRGCPNERKPQGAGRACVKEYKCSKEQLQPRPAGKGRTPAGP